VWALARARRLRDGGHRVSCLWLPAPFDVGGAFADTDADADADAAAVVADAGACVFGPWLQPPEEQNAEQRAEQQCTTTVQSRMQSNMQSRV